MALPYPSMVFTPFDILTAEEMNHMVDNDQALADGSGFDSDIDITTSGDITTTGKLDASGASSVLLPDTGWITLSQASGFTTMSGTGMSESAYRVIGNIVYIHAGANGNFSTYTSFLSDKIPSKYCPSQYRYLAAFGSGNRGYVAARIKSDGEIQAGFNKGGKGLSSPGWIAIGGSYPLD